MGKREWRIEIKSIPFCPIPCSLLPNSPFLLLDTMNWFKLAVQLRGSVAPAILPRVLSCGAFGFGISLLYYFDVPIPALVLGNVITSVVFNLVLGLLLVFRTNSAYDRFWEGRKNWGTLVVNIRNLARQIWVGVAETELDDREKKAAALRLLDAFAIATKLRLRKEALNHELESRVNSEQFVKLQAVKSPPLEIIRWLGEYLQQQHERQGISSNQLLAMNKLLDSLVEGLTGCERILTTPIPPAYAIYLRRVMLLYCFLLPLQIVESVKMWTGLNVAIVSFVLLGVEEIGKEIENPFGCAANDLPLDEICATIRDNIEDIVAPKSDRASSVEALNLPSVPVD